MQRLTNVTKRFLYGMDMNEEALPLVRSRSDYRGYHSASSVAASHAFHYFS